jgi:hypothetical protein
VFTELFPGNGRLWWLHSSGPRQTCGNIKIKNRRKENKNRKLMVRIRRRVGKKRRDSRREGTRKTQSRRK